MTQISKEYALALFSLATEKNEIDNYSAALCKIGDIIRGAEGYIELLKSPSIPLSERLALIDEAFAEGFCEDIVNFIKILCENSRIDLILECIDDFLEYEKTFKNSVTARVISAVEMTDAQKERLTQKLCSLTGKSVDIKCVIDAGLIGGIRIEIEDKVIDGSILGRLNSIKGVINK